jgi:cobalt-zinc-cadmium efflux system membrane fusion protein
MKRLDLICVCCLAFLSCGKPKSAVEGAQESQAKSAPKTSEKSQSEKGESNAVEMSSEAQQRAGVAVAPAAIVPMTQYLQVTGSVQPMDSSVAHVRPLARGRLLEIRAKAGDRVAEGQVLAQIDNIEAGELIAQYNSARSELQKLRIQLTAQQRQVERNRRLAEIGASPKKDYESTLAEQQGMEEGIRAQESTVAGINARLHRFGIDEIDGSTSPTSAIRAPFAGVVIHMDAAPGEIVEAGADLFTVANLSTVYVQAQVYEKDLGQVNVGQTVFITVDSYPGQPFTGRVVSISQLIDPQTRTAPVRCQVDNSAAKLKLDMLASIRFSTSTKRAALSVPADALQTIDNRPVVFVQTSPIHFEVRPVEAGAMSEGRTEIVRGLKDGEVVVSRGAFAVKSVLLAKELGEEK